MMPLKLVVVVKESIFGVLFSREEAGTEAETAAAAAEIQLGKKWKQQTLSKLLADSVKKPA